MSKTSAGILSLMLCSLAPAPASTLVQGNVSGEWNPAGSPYIAIDNITVPAGARLTIRPGTTVQFDAMLGLTVNGTIMATGAPTSGVVFQRLLSDAPWNTITVNYSATNAFFYNCDFSGARLALNFVAEGQTAHNETMQPRIVNCSFSGCQEAAIAASAIGYYAIHNGWTEFWYPVCYPQVFNSSFSNMPLAILLLPSGRRYSYMGGHADATGSITLSVRNCTFSSITGNAVQTQQSGPPGTSWAEIYNNVFSNCGVGLNAIPDFAFTVMNNLFKDCATGVLAGSATSFAGKNNIFMGCGIAVNRTGTALADMTYNCFHGNSTNFAGCPAIYGRITGENANGTACDLAGNIFADPVFRDQVSFQLESNSPCIDAGSPDWACTDMCFPPSQGQTTSDLGIYGGPNACNWLDSVPLLPVTAWMSQSDGLANLNWGAIPRATYQVFSITNQIVTIPATNSWTNFANGRITAVNKMTSVLIRNHTATTQQFFRIQSLGRSAGN